MDTYTTNSVIIERFANKLKERALQVDGLEYAINWIAHTLLNLDLDVKGEKQIQDETVHLQHLIEKQQNSIKECNFWVPVDGTIKTTRTGRQIQYVKQTSTGSYAYLDVNTNTILSDQEAAIYISGIKSP